MKKTLPTDSAERKNYPLLRGCLNYFPAALAGVAHTSKIGNDKHNPGEPLHHARGKSMDHGDCILRHLMDLEDLIAANAEGTSILEEANSLAWRALALSQELHERFGAPLAPAAEPATIVAPTLDNSDEIEVSLGGVVLNNNAPVRIPKGD